MFNSRSAVFGIVLLGITHFVADTHATVLPRYALPDLLDHSELLFSGRIIKKNVDVDQTGLPWTQYVFTDLDIIAGNYSEKEIRVRCAGGDTGTYVSVLVGTPEFEVGDEVVTFFDEDDGACQFTGWIQGALRIVRSRAPGAGNKRIVVDHRGNAIAGLTPGGFVKADRPNWLAQRRSIGNLARAGKGHGPKSTGIPADAAAPWEAVREDLAHYVAWRGKVWSRQVRSSDRIIGSMLGRTTGAQ